MKKWIVAILTLVLLTVPLCPANAQTPEYGQTVAPAGSIYLYDLANGVWRAASSTAEGLTELVSPAFGTDSPAFGTITSPRGAMYIYDLANTVWRAATCDSTGKMAVTVGGDAVSLDTANFDNNLSAADDTVQAALETLDELVAGGGGGDFTDGGDTAGADRILGNLDDFLLTFIANNVPQFSIGTGGVTILTQLNLPTGEISEADLATNSVTNTKIGTGAVDTDELANDAVDATKLDEAGSYVMNALTLVRRLIVSDGILGATAVTGEIGIGFASNPNFGFWYDSTETNLVSVGTMDLVSNNPKTYVKFGSDASKREGVVKWCKDSTVAHVFRQGDSVTLRLEAANGATHIGSLGPYTLALGGAASLFLNNNTYPKFYGIMAGTTLQAFKAEGNALTSLGESFYQAYHTGAHGTVEPSTWMEFIMSETFDGNAETPAVARWIVVPHDSSSDDEHDVQLILEMLDPDSTTTAAWKNRMFVTGSGEVLFGDDVEAADNSAHAQVSIFGRSGLPTLGISNHSGGGATPPDFFCNNDSYGDDTGIDWTGTGGIRAYCDGVLAMTLGSTAVTLNKTTAVNGSFTVNHSGTGGVLTKVIGYPNVPDTPAAGFAMNYWFVDWDGSKSYRVIFENGTTAEVGTLGSGGY